MTPSASVRRRCSRRGPQAAAAASCLGLLDGLVDAADHVEGLLGQVVVLAFDDLLEAADRLAERDVLARRAGEVLGDEEGLGEEALDPAGAADDQLVLVGELVDTEDGDDVLEVLVALEDLLHLARRRVVLLADDVRFERAVEVESSGSTAG